MVEVVDPSMGEIVDTSMGVDDVTLLLVMIRQRLKKDMKS
jgi:hypothetical protein